ETAVTYRLISRAPAFLPSLSVRRADAITVAVTALGYTFEAGAMSARALPYDDAGTLSPLARGAVAVAVYLQPPLLREPPAPVLRPQAAMTRGEAAALVWGYLQALEPGAMLRDATAIAPGVELTTEKRGALRTLPVLRIQIGAFVQESNAQQLAATMRSRGLNAVVDLEDGFFKVRVGSFASPAEAELIKDQLAQEGYPTWLLTTVPNPEILPAPFWTAVIVVDPRAGTLQPSIGDGLRMVAQRTSAIARRTGALAAVNGDFYSSGGDPLGCLIVAGVVWSEPHPERTCGGIAADRSLILDRVRFAGTVSTADGTIPISGVNRSRGTDELILYRPEFDASTRTNQFGAEATVVGGVVTSVTDGQGNTPVPRDGVVLSGHGRARQWIAQRLAAGTAVTIDTRLVSVTGDPRWERVVHALGGGPRLLVSGQIAGSEGFPRTFTDRRHPRTAIGVLADGRIVLLVVDGRSPYHSLGMTLMELAMELRRLGAVDALNLDGGGSTTMVVHGRIINLPSDENGERPVGSVLLVMPP
ncbi:MAG: phosphodiester glycosidase family protein, partial [bacterium]